MAAPLEDVRAAIHKTAAGRMSQTTAPAQAPSSVNLDLSVLASQSKDYSAGAAAGGRQAEGNAAANAQLLTEDKAAADSDRAQAIDLVRQNSVELELKRQAAAQEAQQTIAQVRQEAAVAAQKAQAQAQAAAADRAAAQQEKNMAAQEKANAEAEEREGKVLGRRLNEYEIDLTSRTTANFSGAFNMVVEESPDVGTALSRIEALRRNNRLPGSPASQAGMARRLSREVSGYYNLARR